MESVIQPLVPGVQEDGTAYRKSPYDTRPFLARQLLKRRPKEVVLMTEELLWLFVALLGIALFVVTTFVAAIILVKRRIDQAFNEDRRGKERRRPTQGGIE